MIQFKNREEQKKYSFLVSSLNIDFAHLGNGLAQLFTQKEESEDEGKIDEVRHLLKDIASSAIDLEKSLEAATS